ncbi:MAG: tripartite tricarboxylate transporter substrate-binding protein [Chromatiales bacterium]|nr:tripartite tricarboxylate transporter substrate-binding protein [Chromatiales bacterium]
MLVLLTVAVGVAYRPRRPGSRTSQSPSSCPGAPADRPTRSPASARASWKPRSGQKIVIVNQPGASGSVGTKNALDAPKDGYTWTAGAAADLATYKVQGMLDTDIRNDWHIFLSVANVSVVGVNAATPYKTFDDLLDAMKKKPGQVTVATAGAELRGAHRHRD